MLLPLVLAQFICSYAASNMNVAISSIAADLGTTVSGVQTTITVFTLTMAALMIPGSKLTDIWGRKVCLRGGLVIYGVGALIAAVAPGLGILILGYSLLEGIGTALLIPPVYILATVFSPDLNSRARAFGAISAAGGIGAAAGPLIGGLITSTTSWRVSFLAQVLVVAIIFFLSRRIVDPGVQGVKPRFDTVGAVLSAAGLFFVVIGILQADTYGWFRASQDFVIGCNGRDPGGRHLSALGLRGDRSALTGRVLLAYPVDGAEGQGASAAHQDVPEPRLQSRPRDAEHPVAGPAGPLLRGLRLPAGGPGLQRDRDRSDPDAGHDRDPGLLDGRGPAGAAAFPGDADPGGLCRDGVGMLLLLLLAREASNVLTFVPGLLLVGLGVGVMLTSSVTVVQSSFPEEDQGEISGLSRSVSNLGSSLGVAIAGTVIVSSLVTGNLGYALALVVLAVFAGIGLVAAILLPANPVPEALEPGPGPA